MKYTEAVEWFEKAAARKPDAVDARLYLGTAYMTQYILGVPSRFANSCDVFDGQT